MVLIMIKIYQINLKANQKTIYQKTQHLGVFRMIKIMLISKIK